MTKAAIATGARQKRPALPTTVCLSCSFEDPFGGPDRCSACGSKEVWVRDDSPDECKVDVFEQMSRTAAADEDEADSRKEWREDNAWSLGVPRGKGW